MPDAETPKAPRCTSLAVRNDVSIFELEMDVLDLELDSEGRA